MCSYITHTHTHTHMILKLSTGFMGTNPLLSGKSTYNCLPSISMDSVNLGSCGTIVFTNGKKKYV